MINQQELLQRAQLLCLKGNNEVDYRIAAGRAYYFVFHRFKTYFNQTPASQITHNQLIKLLQNSANSLLKKAAIQMTNCKRLREKADYRLDNNFIKKQAEYTIEYALQIDSLLK